MGVSPDWARARFVESAIARLATVRAGDVAIPHLIPVVFAVDGDTVYSAVDAKPKRSMWLQRLANLTANPDVCLLVDHYEADWTRLWWARADGTARILHGDDAEAGVRALVAKYPQYVAAPPLGAVTGIDVTRWTGWCAADASGGV